MNLARIFVSRSFDYTKFIENLQKDRIREDQPRGMIKDCVIKDEYF